MKEISEYFHCKESELSNFSLKENSQEIFSFSFTYEKQKYNYLLNIKEKEYFIEASSFNSI